MPSVNSAEASVLGYYGLRFPVVETFAYQYGWAFGSGGRWIRR
jgi:hypothetical protein